MNKGDMLESDLSLKFHHQGVPALISSALLRSLNLGQVDIVYLERNHSRKWVIKIIETKFSQYPSQQQMMRLRRTQDYLSRVLEMESKLEVKFCQKADSSLSF